MRSGRILSEAWENESWFLVHSMAWRYDQVRLRIEYTQLQLISLLVGARLSVFTMCVRNTFNCHVIYMSCQVVPWYTSQSI
jgi:hypothetical protein